MKNNDHFAGPVWFNFEPYLNNNRFKVKKSVLKDLEKKGVNTFTAYLFFTPEKHILLAHPDVKGEALEALKESLEAKGLLSDYKLIGYKIKLDAYGRIYLPQLLLDHIGVHDGQQLMVFARTKCMEIYNFKDGEELLLAGSDKS